MLICPNKNLKEWKDLAASVGENRAMLMWYESEGKVGFTLSAQTTILDNLSKVNSWFKQMKDTDTFWNKLQKDLQIPKDQISLLKESNGKTIEEKLISFVTDYSYTVEINTAKANFKRKVRDEITGEEYIDDSEATGEDANYYSNLTVPGGINYTENEISTPLITPSIKGHAQFATDNGIGWFRSDEESTGEKLDRFKVIKNGLEQISKNTRKEAEDFIELHSKNWKSDKSEYSIVEDKFDIRPHGSKTRRILEVQSDLFQKGRDRKNLISSINIPRIQERRYITQEDIDNGDAFPGAIVGDEYEFESSANSIEGTVGTNSSENQFLQLLNKDNNWVTFFIKAVIQDSAKKGYEKVLFPKGETAAKIEGHETIAEEIRKIDEAINNPDKEYDKNNRAFAFDTSQGVIIGYTKSEFIDNLTKRKSELKSQGIEKLKPIEAFYEIKVGNILEKLFGKDNVKVITDEYGNTWNEVELLDDLLENFTIGSFKPRIPIPVPINNSLEELYKEDVENSNNNCTFDTGK